MANEIVKTVAKKANISESIAQVAVDTVLNLLKDKLPSTFGSVLDSFLGSSGTASKSTKPAPKSSTPASKSTKKSDNPLGDLGSIADAIGGLLGKK